MSDRHGSVVPPMIERACGCAYRLVRGYPLAFSSVRRCRVGRRERC